MLTSPDHCHRRSMPTEEAELLPCARIAGRWNSPKERSACDSRPPRPRESRTEGPAPKRDEPALLPPHPLRGSLGKTAAWLEEKDHRRWGSLVAAASPSQFLFEAILAEWLRQRRP